MRKTKELPVGTLLSSHLLVCPIYIGLFLRNPYLLEIGIYNIIYN